LYFKKVNLRASGLQVPRPESPGQRNMIRIGHRGRTRGAKLAMTGKMGENA
jgi:hypothetical protein